MSDSDRRAGPRLKTLITTGVTAPGQAASDETPLAATCLDLSAAGMVLTLRRAIKVGSVVIATLDLPGGSINAYATVLRCEPTKRAGRWKIAVRFDSLFEDDRQRISEFVQAESEKRLC